MSKLFQNTSLVPRIIACMDVAYGRVVKGTNFKQLLDMGDPIQMGLQYQHQGADELVFLDIKASVDKQESALSLVNKVAKTLSIPFTVGGGLKVLSDVDKFFNAGADKVTLNTAAVENPDLIDQIANKHGSQSLIVAVDVNLESNGELVLYTHGGSKRVKTQYSQWMNEVINRGAGEIMINAMHKDGTGSGFDLNLLKQADFPLPIIASGGANGPKDFLDAINAGADAVLAAGIFHRGEFTVAQIKNYLLQNNIKMRTLAC
jgi:cyclase